MAISACNFKSVETSHFAKPDIGLHVLHFGGDHIKGFIKIEAMCDFELGTRLDVLNPLPPIHDGKLCACSRHYRRQRRSLRHPRGRAVFMREVKPKFVLIIFNCFQRGHFNIRMPCKAAWVGDPGIVASLAMNDLLCKQPTVAAAFAQTSAQANDAKCISLSRNGADQWCAVDCVCDWAIDHCVYSRLHQCGHAGECAFQNVGDPIQIVGAEGIDEFRVDPIHSPGFAVLLIEP